VVVSVNTSGATNNVSVRDGPGGIKLGTSSVGNDLTVQSDTGGIGQDVGASLTVPGVPPGRYYVRIRSVNGTGVGAPSNEAVVDVP